MRGNPIHQSTSNLSVLCIASSANGRVFLGCEDNDIYELDYRSNAVTPSSPSPAELLPADAGIQFPRAGGQPHRLLGAAAPSLLPAGVTLRRQHQPPIGGRPASSPLLPLQAKRPLRLLPRTHQSSRGNRSIVDSEFEFAFELSDVTQAIMRFCQSSPRESSSHVLSALNSRRDVTPLERFSVACCAVDRRDSRDSGEGRVSPRGYRRFPARLFPPRFRPRVSTMKLPHLASLPISSSTRCVFPPREPHPSWRPGSFPAGS